MPAGKPLGGGTIKQKVYKGGLERREMEDVIIRNITIADGTGSPLYRGDVAWKNGVITAAGDASMLEGQTVIDAEPGWVLAPGFIDTHTHNDQLVFIDHTQWPQLLQGITTEITGSCGISPFPHTEEHLDELKKYCAQLSMETDDEQWHKWATYKGYREDALAHDPLINDLHLVGHGSLRIAAMGMDNRAPSEEEMECMKTLLRGAMEGGAIGLSTGLIYPPGTYADKDELIELCKVIAEYNGVYSTHMRNEGAGILGAIQEAIDIGMSTGCKVLISHHKLMVPDPGLQQAAYDLMQNARESGLRLINDQYMYNTGSTTMTALLPPFALQNGIPELVKNLKDTEYQKQIRKVIEEDSSWQNFLMEVDRDTIIIIRADKTPEYQGLSIAEAARRCGVDEIEMLIRIMVENEGNATMVLQFSDMEMVERIFKSPYTAIGSDGIGAGNGHPAHPRAYDNQVRVFSEFVRKRGAVSLEEAVRKCTSLPADFLGINKGQIAEGKDADIVIFDPEVIGSKASMAEPICRPDGIEYVFINGTMRVKKGEIQ